MRLGLAVWGDRLSPVLDTCRQVWVVEPREGRHADLGREAPRDGEAVDAWIARLRLDCLVCGAVSAPLGERLAASGLDVRAFRCGEAGAILRAWAQGALAQPRYSMPGCCRARRGLQPGGCGRGRRGRGEAA